MARYVKDYTHYADPQASFEAVQQYLTSEGYEYIEYNGENVFKKGHGLLVAPRFIKVSFYQGAVRIEAWMKYALLPGVYCGEIGLTGFFGSAVRGPLEDVVANLERMFVNSGSVPIQGAYTPQGGYGMQTPTPQQDAYAVPTMDAVPNRPMFPAGTAISKKEFIEKYAPVSFKSGIRNAAICAYICAGITAVYALITSPWALIDAAVFLGLTLGMHLGKSKVCAILMLVVSIVECILGFVMTGTFTSFLWIAASVWAVSYFRKADKQYEEFLSGNGMFPQ